MISKKTKTVVPIVAIILFLIIILAIKVRQNNEYELVITTDSLLQVVTSGDQLVKPDELAGLIETNTERFVIIDIRSQHNYNVNHIEGAINISFNDILDNHWCSLFSDQSFKKILYCDYDINSNEAWMLLSQLSYKNIFVLEGGIKYWEEHILTNYAPFSRPSNDEHPLYNYKKEMNKSGQSADPGVSEKDSSPIPVMDKKKKSVEGGCG